MNVFVFFFNYVEVAVAWVLGSLCGTIFFKHNICMYSIEYLWKINYDMEHLTPKKKKKLWHGTHLWNGILWRGLLIKNKIHAHRYYIIYLFVISKHSIKRALSMHVMRSSICSFIKIVIHALSDAGDARKLLFSIIYVF